MLEQQLIDSVKQKNEKSFEELIKITEKKVKPTIFSSFPSLNNTEFEEAYQIATIKAWNKIETFRGQATFATWFTTILRNEVCNILKRKIETRQREISLEEIKSASSPEEGERYSFEGIVDKNGSGADLATMETARSLLEKRDELQLMKKMLSDVFNSLNPDHGQILKLAYEEGKSYKEISDELSIPIGTVMSRIYFARRHAQRLIKQYAKRNELQLSYIGQPN